MFPNGPMNVEWREMDVKKTAVILRGKFKWIYFSVASANDHPY